LTLIIIVLYRKYKVTKLRLDYEVNDVRNMASVVRSDNELKNMNAIRGKEKYLNLNEESTR
jgi:hypothetical protein